MLSARISSERFREPARVSYRPPCIYDRAHAIERFVNTELREYRRIFAPSSEVYFAPSAHSVSQADLRLPLIQAGHLDNTARRFAWFRRVMKNHDEDYAPLFPPKWEVDRILVAKFADSTR